MHYLVSTLFVAGLAMAGAVRAESPAAPPQGCASAQTEADMERCLAAQLEESDRALNALYRKLIADYTSSPSSITPDAESQDAAFQRAQRAWLTFRDASCGFETYDSRGGSGFDTINTECLLKHTRERVDYLEWHAEHP